MNNTLSLIVAFILGALIAIAVMYVRFKSGYQPKPFKAGGDDTVGSDSLNLAINRLKPHFLNNILTTIYYLCDTDPQKAQALSATFSEYLLNALEALKANEPVSFTWELGLIRNYLSLEKTRLEDKLNVDYDVDITDFKVPALSVLMLVENAVKQGIAGSDKAGTVCISTRRLAGGLTQIKVTDTGAKHDKLTGRAAEESKQDFDAVRRLLKQHYNGELEIAEQENGGTSAIITMRPA